MDYKKIIVNGVLDENTRSHLDLYFYREYENAKEEKYSFIEFFSGLNKGIKELFTAIVNKREEKIKRLEEEIKLNELSPRPYDTPEQAKKEIERLKSKVDIILNSESSIDIENENYKTEITLKALESVLFNINRAFDRAKNNEGETMPPHQIFTTEKGEQIFKEWHDMHKDAKSHADYSFIFRAMEKDGFLQSNVGESLFRNHLDNYDVVLGKLKTFDKCTTPKKQNLYNQIKMSKK